MNVSHFCHRTIVNVDVRKSVIDLNLFRVTNTRELATESIFSCTNNRSPVQTRTFQKKTLHCFVLKLQT